MRTKSLVAACLILGLPGCATTTTAPILASNFCTIASPIYVDPADRVTPITDREIAAHNKMGEDLCGWLPLQSTPAIEVERR